MDEIFKEFKVGITPEQTRSLKRNTQEKHKQYGLQNSVTRTINSTQGGKFISITTYVSLGE